MIGTHQKIRMSHSMVEQGKQRRRRGDRSGDSKSSFVPTATEANNDQAVVKVSVVDQAKQIMQELQGPPEDPILVATDDGSLESEALTDELENIEVKNQQMPSNNPPIT